MKVMWSVTCCSEVYSWNDFDGHYLFKSESTAKTRFHNAPSSAVNEPLSPAQQVSNAKKTARAKRGEDQRDRDNKVIRQAFTTAGCPSNRTAQSKHLYVHFTLPRVMPG